MSPLIILVTIFTCYHCLTQFETLAYRTHWIPSRQDPPQQQHQDHHARSFEYRAPREIMVDVINNMGLHLLEVHNEHNENNIALSPYGATSVLVALVEGLVGQAALEIRNAIELPPDLATVRVGLRDIHRHLKSYFIPKEGFLAGLTLSHENITLNREYESILKFYGYDIESFNNPVYAEVTTATPQVTRIDDRISTNLADAPDQPSTTMQSTAAMTTNVPVMTTEAMEEATTPMVDATKLPAPEDEDQGQETTTKKVPTRSFGTTVSSEEILENAETQFPTSTIATTLESTREAVGREAVDENANTAPTTEMLEKTTEEIKVTTGFPPESSTLISSSLVTTTLTDEEITTQELTTTTEVGTTTITTTTEVGETTQETTQETTTEDSDVVTLTQVNEIPLTELSQKLTNAEVTEFEPYLETESTQSTSLEDLVLATKNTSFRIPTTETSTRKKRSVIDYLIARYYDNYYINNNRPSGVRFLPEPEPQILYQPEEPYTFLINGKFREPNISFMTYDTVLPFCYIRELQAVALSFPLDSSMYYLLLVLPLDENGIDKLIQDMRQTSLRSLVENLQYTHVKAVIPSFMLRGYVVLTPSLQKLCIKSIFEPRQADFSQMTTEKNMYVTNIEQAVTVTIRNYVDPAQSSARNMHQERPVEFRVDHPFLYFVMDSQIHVNLMAGKIINPLNSRIR